MKRNAGWEKDNGSGWGWGERGGKGRVSEREKDERKGGNGVVRREKRRGGVVRGEEVREEEGW